MKKRFPALSGLLLVLLAAALAGCSDSVPEPEIMAAPRPAITEQETEVILGAEVLTGAEIDRLKTSREQIPPDDERVVLYYNGVELACSGGRSVFYATIPEADSNDSWPGGTLSGPVGYRVIIEKDYTYKNPSELIASGTPLSVFLIGESDYAAVEAVLTYLPVISIQIDDGADLGNALKGAWFTVHDSATSNKNKQFTRSRAEVKLRGGSSSSLPKKSIRIDLKNESGENLDMSFFGMRKDDDWILTAMYSDESKIRDMTAWQIWREMNSYYPDVNGSCAPETEYVEVILNGQYQGLYIFMEKFDAKTMKLEAGNNDVLFKAASWDVPDSAGLKKQSSRSTAYKAFEKKWPDSLSSPSGCWDAIAEYIRAAYETDGVGFADDIAAAASIENQLDYWIFNNVTMAGDNTFKNAYYAVKDGLVYTLPWDLDISFGLNWNGDPSTNYLYRAAGNVTHTYDFQVGRRLLKYYEGAAEYVQTRWAELKENGIFTAEGIINIAENYWDLIHSSGAIIRECNRWPSVSYSDDFSYFKRIVEKRMIWLDDYIEHLGQ